MSDFDAELDRRIAELKAARERGESPDGRSAPATQSEAEALAGQLAASIGSRQLRFLAVAPGEVGQEDEDEDGDLLPRSEDSWLVSIWFDGHDSALGYIRPSVSGGGVFEPYWANDASLYFDDVEGSDAIEFAASLRSELLSGLANYLAESADED